MAFNPEERMKNIMKVIQEDADDKAHSIQREGKEKSSQLKNKAFATLRESLIAEFKKKQDNEEVRLKT